MFDDTFRQLPLREVPRGAFLRRKADAKKTYIRGEYDRFYKRFRCDDCDDISRDMLLKGNALVWVGFTY